MTRNANTRPQLEDVLLGGSSATQAEIARLVNLAASVRAPVLITGETGTGKNVVAATIHHKSPLDGRNFVSINCAALQENLIEAELFGHERGAFTGAVNSKRGIFEMAEGGTLFLDEIGDMPFHLQTKLLSVIEDKRVRRLGGSAFLPVSARILAATRARVEEALDRTFRSDLYFRLSVIHIHLPPLRERREDIPDFCAFLLSRLGDRPVRLEPRELERLMDYDWPGNIRELKNALERATLMQKGPFIRPSEILGRTGQQSLFPEPSPEADEADGPICTLQEVEHRHIARALRHFSFNLTRTARALGISRSTLKRKMHAAGLKRTP